MSAPKAAPRDLIFISYSRDDRDWLERLLILLKPYTRQSVKVWADPYIEVGGKWRREIEAALSRTSVGMLLLSPNFFASDFVNEGHTGSVNTVAVLADDNRVLSGSDDNTLRLWNLSSGACFAEYTADCEISSVGFQQSDLIIAGSADGKIHILEIREPEP